MLSYRHAYHAGNHADVLKHMVLVALLDYLTTKPKTLWYVDTHAGAGLYPLDEGVAREHREHETGIGRLFNRADLPEPVARYVALVRRCSPDGRLTRYPGSPWIARELTRAEDRLWLYERHPADARHLANRLADPRTKVVHEDGFKGLAALLPPAPRRCLVLLDPAYELKSDYDRVMDTLKDALRRFATGTYALWYPLLTNRRSEQLIRRLRTLPAERWLDVQLRVRSATRPGMYGSGMRVLNPPYTLPAMLETTLPFLTTVLAQDDGAAFALDRVMR